MPALTEDELDGGTHERLERDQAAPKPFINHHQILAGRINRMAITQWGRTHPFGTQQECARDLNLSLMAVNRHVKAIREEWRLTDAGVVR